MSAAVLSIAMCSSGLAAQPAVSREPYEIEIYTNINGTSTYVLGVALADIINKYSTWLKATAMESPGPNETAMMLINEPDKQTRAIGYLITQDALLGYPPYDGPNEDLRNLAAYGLVSNLYMTTNPALKTLKDLDGKRVALGTRPNIPRVDIQEKIFAILGAKPTFEYLPFNDAVTALSDGKIDALVGGGFAISAAADKWAPNPAMAELLARAKISYISMEADSLWQAKTEMKHMLLPGVLTVPGGKFDPNWDQPLTLQADYLCWAAHKNLPDDVVTEILTQMADHADEFVNYVANGAYISQENMAKMDMPEWIHPAAAAFYKERGIAINTRP
jgi:TRAP transporter TAXI family solute receptor